MTTTTDTTALTAAGATIARIAEQLGTEVSGGRTTYRGGCRVDFTPQRDGSVFAYACVDYGTHGTSYVDAGYYRTAAGAVRFARKWADR